MGCISHVLLRVGQNTHTVQLCTEHHAWGGRGGQICYIWMHREEMSMRPPSLQREEGKTPTQHRLQPSTSPWEERVTRGNFWGVS